MKKVNDQRSYKLTTGEIYVLAGLLGHNTVYGVESDTLDRWRDDIGGNVSSVVSELAASGYAELSFGGVLYIDSTLRKAIDCLCMPETMVSVAVSVGNCLSEKYCICTGNVSVMLERNKNGRVYCLRVTDNCAEAVRYILSCTQKMLNVQGHSRDIPHLSRVQIPYECAAKAKSLIAGFREEEARELLHGYLTQEDTEKVMEILGGNIGHLSVKAYSAENGICQCGYKGLFVTGAVDAEITADNESNIHINEISSDEIENIVNKNISSVRREALV